MNTDLKTAHDAAAAERLFGLLPPIFGMAVEPDAMRFDLRLPRVRGGYVYATDGRVIVRAPLTPTLEDAARDAAAEAGPHGGCGEFPSACAAEFDRPGGWRGEGRPVPDLTWAAPCPACGGACVRRGGPCGECYGVGFENPLVRGADVGGARLSFYYLTALRDAGATLYPATVGTATSPVRFTLPDRTEGLVMPVAPGGGS